jgi:hypothetical protein
MDSRRLFILKIITVGFFLASGTYAAGDALVYPKPTADFDKRSEYPLRLLKLALAKSGAKYELVPGDTVMNKARVAVELADGHIDVAWMVTNREREAKNLPVRICIFKGLGGWRAALIRKGDEARFSGIAGLSDLRKLQAGQQEDWPDTAILRNSGIPVITTTSYDTLFKMLQAGRFDWFPRNIMEIWDEAEIWKEKGIAIETHLLIRYPSAYYFFVNKNNPELAAQIERGLKIALADGSFDALFIECHGDVVAKAKVGNRLIIDIPNPYFPTLSPRQGSD